MPLGPSRQYYQPGSQGARPRVVPGLTGGPGYVSQMAPQTQTNQQPQRQATQTPQNQSTQIGNTQASPLAFPQRPPGPAFNALDEQTQEVPSPFPNPNLQYGTHDTGYGWTNVDLNDAHAHGYDLDPEGIYVFSDTPF